MGVIATIVRRVDQYFPDRQILVRANGELQCITLSKRVQVAGSLSLCAGVIIALAAAFQLATHAQTVANRDAQIASLTTANDRLTADMRQIQARYEIITNDLESKHAYLREVLAMSAGLERTLAEVNSELQQTADERDEAQADSERLENNVSTLGSQLDLALATADRLERNLARLGSELTNTSSARLATDQQNRELSQNLRALQGRLQAVEVANQDLTASLADSTEQVKTLSTDRGEILSRNTMLRARVDQLEGRLAMLESSQRQLVDRIRDRTNASIEDLEAAVSLTGLDLDHLLNRVQEAVSDDEPGLGGPLLAMATSGDPDDTDAFQSRVVHLEGRLDRWAALNKALEVLPIAAPMEEFRITSGYGPRKDPFTKRRAFHSGLDFAGPWRSKVLTTAPGVVKFAGRKGAYGKSVVIDHGHGIVTRYGHLHKITVKKGDVVKFQQQIGVMGNTGRSRGSHLHYEVVYDGKTLDPARFLKAGKHVFKQLG